MDPLLFIASCASLLSALFALWFLLKEPRALAARLIGVGLWLLSAETLLAGMAAAALLPERMLILQRLRLITASVVPGIWLAFSLVYARSNYREFLRRWRWPLWLFIVGLPLVAGVGWQYLAMGVVMVEGKLYWSIVMGPAAFVVRAAGILCAAFVVMNLEQTFREARGMTRWRIKDVLAGVLTIFVLRIFFDGQALLLTEWNPAFEPVLALGLVAGCLLMVRSLRRLQHLHVDLYVSTSVVFGSIAAFLVAAYLLLIGVVTQVWRHGAWQAVGLLAAVGVVAGLVLIIVLLLSDRARVLMRRVLTRHLQRPSFDYRQLWHDFSQRTRQAVRVEDVAGEVTRLVSETFEALSVSVWLLEGPHTLRKAASSDPMGGGRGARPVTVVDAETLTHWQKADRPMDLDRLQAAWADALRDSNPTRFPEGGHRFCMPIKDAQSVLGLMIVGDRVSGVAFTSEELDLLRILADQTAVRMQTVRLAEKLLEAKQWEAFQTMSAFLVHDLKNTASSLSLTLQNLRIHFDDPAFRKDAERSISAGVGRMNALIRKLTGLRESREPRPSRVDLSTWLTEVLKALDDGPSGVIRFSPGPSLPVRMDTGGIQSVVTNLVLNAKEASPAGAPIHVQVEAEQEWAVLTVRDEGCGMAADYLADRLFRPFQTTKKDGMGIGLFQTRRIVEAHGGRIDVESAPGQGSTFRVRLPLEEGYA